VVGEAPDTVCSERGFIATRPLRVGTAVRAREGRSAAAPAWRNEQDGEKARLGGGPPWRSGGAPPPTKSCCRCSATRTSGSWPTGIYASWRYSELNQINRETVRNLRPSWQFSTGVLRGHEGGPLVVGDMMYVHTPFPNRVIAMDLNTPGRVIWRYEPQQDPTVIGVMCCDTVNRGPAYGDGKIILSQADTTLVALDAKTGKESGRSRTATPPKARPRRWRR
jgi:hypothetical protein